MLTIKLQGGLGNQLFQLAAAESIAGQTNKTFYISSFESPRTVHSNMNYFNSIFKNWKTFFHKDVSSKLLIETSNMSPELWSNHIDKHKSIILQGYFQNYNYIEPIYNQFIERLSFDDTILIKYPDTHNRVFVHIRGGDYVNSKFHELDLKEYYQNAFKIFDKEKFYIFTNDKHYAIQFLNNIDYEYIDENDVDSLYLMSKCKGGICANSSFSWWGAYLNKKRKIIMPSKWYNDEKMYIDGYYFDGVIRLNIS